MSGYTHCACRDCFDIAISGDDGPALCAECKEAECSPWPTEWAEQSGEPFPQAVGYDCQRGDAYGAYDDPEDAKWHAENGG